MHASVRDFVASVVDQEDLSGRTTLEVGAYDVNGSVRDLFTGRYYGLDLRPGPGVDFVAPAAKLPFLDGEFELVVCVEMLEHDPTPWLTLAEIGRVLEPSGWLVLSCRGFDARGCFPPHDFPDDFYRYTPGAVSALLEHAGNIRPLAVGPDPEYPGVFAVGTRREEAPTD